MRTSTYYYYYMFLVSKVVFFWSVTGSVRFASSFLLTPFVRTTTGLLKKIELQGSTLSQKDDGCCDQQPIPLSQENKERILISDTPTVLPSDPHYVILGPIGMGDFIVSREGPPRREELTNENLLKIVLMECTDLEVNTLVWKCLGYRFDTLQQVWTSDECFPKWREKYPTPPDFIGMQRIYRKDVDEISLRSTQDLARSIPMEHKQQLKRHLLPLGFKGYQLAGLTPNKTRRAQCANWLLFFREELFGFSIEELKKRREQKQQEEVANLDDTKSATDDWKPPTKEVF